MGVVFVLDMVEHGGKMIPVRFDFGWLAGHTSEAWKKSWRVCADSLIQVLSHQRAPTIKLQTPKMIKEFFHHFFWQLFLKPWVQMVQISKNLMSFWKSKQACEKLGTFFVGFQICLFEKAISRANAWLPHVGVEPSRVVRVTQLPVIHLHRCTAKLALRMWTQSRCPRRRWLMDMVICIIFAQKEWVTWKLRIKVYDAPPKRNKYTYIHSIII